MKVLRTVHSYALPSVATCNRAGRCRFSAPLQATLAIATASLRAFLSRAMAFARVVRHLIRVRVRALGVEILLALA